ncbi:GDSL esterase/lipase At1g71250-like [Typha angustifolia]|uniref:GDSL esterase/lipase At1g71250-like n=1 Tax=Typha angustifolia TaxID=59011 RepID=UPI003C2FAEF0
MGRVLLRLLLLFLPPLVPVAVYVGEAPAPAPDPVDSRIPSTALFVLGDSSVNCGDNTLFYPLLPLNFSSSFLCDASRHRLLPDLIADLMRLSRPPPFYGLNGSAAGAYGGVNYGSAQGTIVSSAAAGFSFGGGGYFLVQSLNQQVRQVSEAIQLIQIEAGPAAARHVASSALFLLSFGADDYFRLLARGSESDASAPKYGRRGFARFLVARMIYAIRHLYEADVRRVAVMGVGPLGCSPRVLWEGRRRLDGLDCDEEVNEVIQGYNAKLAARLAKLRSELPDSEFVFCDVYKGVMNIISNPGIYGFENVRKACCGLGQFGGMIGCLAKEMECDVPQKHVWWDFYSTTEAVNALLANWTWWPPSPERQLSICEPMFLKQLARHGIAG